MNAFFCWGAGGEEQCLCFVPKEWILPTKKGSEPGLFELPTSHVTVGM